MFKRFLLLFCTLSLLIISGYAQDNLLDYEYLKLNISNDITMHMSLNDPVRIDSFNIISYFLPQTINGTQYLNSYFISHNGQAVQDGDNFHIVYSLDNTQLSSTVNLHSWFVVQKTMQTGVVSKKVSYPLQVQSSDSKYVEFSDLIDTNEDIRLKASELVLGEDDVYVISNKIAWWIQNNIQYNLSTIQQNPNQKSSQVFVSRKGVCKEITNLYISMMRSLGIPARVVRGFAFTNSPELVLFLGDSWGGHAWSEVKIGDSWIPFDLTYGQYGFVDATHIILEKNPSLSQQAITASFKGLGVSNLVLEQPKQTFTVLEQKDISQSLGMTINVSGIESLQIGSYGYLRVDISNDEPVYKTLFLEMNHQFQMNDGIVGITLLDDPKRMFVFRPLEKRTVYFRFLLPNTLRPQYKYTFPLKVYNQFLSKGMNVEVSADGNYLKEISLPKEEVLKTQNSSNSIPVVCTMDVGYPAHTLSCLAHNQNNQIIDFQMCYLTDCKTKKLALNEKYMFVFNSYHDEVLVKYSYGSQSGEVPVVAKLPTQNIQAVVANQTLIWNSSIKYRTVQTRIELVLNDSIKYTVTKEYDGMKWTLSPGNYSLVAKLFLGERVLDTKKISVTILKKIDTRNIFERFIDWFKQLFY